MLPHIINGPFYQRQPQSANFDFVNPLYKFVVRKMASRFEAVVKKYQEKLKGNGRFPATSFGRSLVGRNGVASRMLFAYLFEDNEKALGFLQEAVLLRNVMPCPKYGRNMTLGKSRQTTDKCCWKCNSVAGLTDAQDLEV
jgi:hypothetical protein